MEIEDGRPRLGPDPEPELDGLGEDDFLLGRQERHASDLAQVEPRRILDVEGIDRRGDSGIRRLIVVVGSHGCTTGRHVAGRGDDRVLELGVVDADGRGHVWVFGCSCVGLGVGIGNGVNELDQDHSTWRQARLERAAFDAKAQGWLQPIHPSAVWFGPYAAPARSRTYVGACQVLTRLRASYSSRNRAF